MAGTIAFVGIVVDGPADLPHGRVDPIGGFDVLISAPDLVGDFIPRDHAVAGQDQ